MSNFFLQCCILILLPLIPATILFWKLQAVGNAQGNLFGMSWSFGGAFAGYLIVLLILWKAMLPYFQPTDAEVWTVRGRVSSATTQDVINRVSIKSFPQSLTLDQSGDYEFKIIVGRTGDTLIFPKVMVDLSLLCGGIRTVRLDDEKGTFPVLENKNSVKIRKSANTHSIDVDTIEVPPPLNGNICGGPA